MHFIQRLHNQVNSEQRSQSKVRASPSTTLEMTRWLSFALPRTTRSTRSTRRVSALAAIHRLIHVCSGHRDSQRYHDHARHQDARPIRQPFKGARRIACQQSEHRVLSTHKPPRISWPAAQYKVPKVTRSYTIWIISNAPHPQTA